MPHLVLLPGLDGSDILLQPLRAALAPWVTTHVVEYGADAYDYETLWPIVRAVVAAQPACFVLGWSFSGPLAIRLAAEPPASLRGVIFCATFASAPWPCGRLLALLVRAPLAVLAPCASLALGSASGELGVQLRRDKRAALARVPAATLAARVRAVLRVDVGASLRACRVPALALVSTRDLVVPWWNVRRLRRQLPTMPVTTLRGGHLALYTCADAAAKAIGAFVGDDASAAAQDRC